MSQSPTSLVISDYVVAAVASFGVSVRATDGTTILAETSYPVDLSGTTTALIGSDGLLASIVDGTLVRIFVTSFSNPGFGPNIVQEAPNGPFDVHALNSGAGSIVVNP